MKLSFFMKDIGRQGDNMGIIGIYCIRNKQKSKKTFSHFLAKAGINWANSLTFFRKLRSDVENGVLFIAQHI